MDNKLTALNAQLELALMEARQSQARADHFSLRITTRAYLEREGHAFDGTGRALTSKELEQKELGTHHQHIQNAEEHLEHAKGILAQINDHLQSRSGY